MVYRRNKAVLKRVLPVVEVLEQRVLYSADALAALAPLLTEETDDDLSGIGSLHFSTAPIGGLTAALHNNTPVSDVLPDDVFRADSSDAIDLSALRMDVLPSSEAIDTVLFVDTSVPDAGKLIKAIQTPSTAVVIIKSNEDGLTKITQTLEGYSHLSSVQILSHGQNGSLFLGSTHVDEQLLIKEQAMVQRWGDALSGTADILLLGCEVAEDEAGQSFVNTLAALTGADVAASDDLTGHSSIQADWDLEFRTGDVSTESLLNSRALAQWVHVLETITLDTFTDEFDIPDGTTMAQLLDLQANFGEQVSLREALYAANQGAASLDTINLPAGNYQLFIGGADDVGKVGDLDSRDDVVIVGQDSASTSITQTALLTRVLDVRSGSLEIQDVTLTGGSSVSNGAGIFALAGTTVTVSGANITGNVASADGGGIYSEGDVNVVNSAVSGNESVFDNGGGLYVTGNLTVSDSTLFNNSSDRDGAAIYGNSVVVLRSEIALNTADGKGGGIYALTDLQLTDSTVRNSQADDDGGGIFAGGTYSLLRSGVNDNTTATEDGGGLFGSGIGSIVDSSFVGNVSDKDGAGLYAEDDVTVSTSLFEGNQADSDGGAIYAHAGVIMVADSGFKDNTAENRGGALWGRDSITVERSSFVNNTATTKEGGAIHQRTQGILSVSNATFAENRADEGGAIYAQRDGYVTSSTFVNNTVATQAASILSDGGTVEVSSSLFENNTVDVAGSGTVFVTTGFNLFDTNLSSSNPLDINNGNFALAPMTTVGYVSAFPLLPGSDAINAGRAASPGATDAQGFARDEVSDIGSSESDSEASVIYWTDGDGAIIRSNTDFTNAQPVVTGRPSPDDLMVDLNQSRIVWLEAGGSIVASTGLDGSGGVTSILTGLADVASIAIDGATAYLYVGFTGANPRIEQYDGAGTLLNTLATGAVANPVDMILNSSSGRLYFAENGGGGVAPSISSVALDGSDLTVHAAATNPQSLAVNSEGDLIFWGEKDSDEIGRLDVTQGSTSFHPTTPDEDPGSMGFDDANDQLVWSSDITDKISTIDDDLLTENEDYTHSASVQEVALAVTSSISAKPVLVQNNDLILNEGADGIISDSVLLSDDADSPPDQIRFVLTQQPLHGTLVVDGVDNATEFTQAQATAGLVLYRHDGNESNADEFQFELKDGLHTSDHYSLGITINPVNDVPTLSPATPPAISLAEGGIYVLQAADLGAADVDNTDSSFAYRFTVPISNGVLQLAGTTLGVGETFTHAQLVAGDVVYRHDGGESSSDSITFVVNDGALDSASAVLDFSIARVNDAPTLNPVTPPAIALAEGAVHILQVSDLAAADVDSAVSSFVYRYTTPLANGTVEIGGVTLGVGSTFTHAQLAAGDVAYRHDGGESSSESITFVVNDGALDSASAVLVFSITGVNDAPVLIIATAPPLAEGGVYVFSDADLAVSDADNAVGEYQYRYTSDMASGQIELNGVMLARGAMFSHTQLLAGDVLYRHNGGELAADSIRFVVSDGVQDSEPALLDFSYRTDNDAPVLNPVTPPSIALNEGATHVLRDVDLGATDVDSADASFVYRYTAPLANGTIELGGSALGIDDPFTHAQLLADEVVYRHDGGESSDERIRFVVSDGMLDSAEAALEFTINRVNDAPVLAASTVIKMAEGDRHVFQSDDLGVTDVDSDASSFVYRYTNELLSGELRVDDLVLARDDFFTQAQLASGAVVYIHGGGENSNDSISFVVSDGDDESVAATLVIDILPVNDSPSVVLIGNTVVENAPGAMVGDVVISDPDQADSHTVSVSDSRFDVVNGVLALNDQEFLDYEQENQVAMELVVEDSAGARVIENVLINVQDANDAPVVVIEPESANGDGFQLPATAFVDSDGDSLRYSATLANGDPLPGWLGFDTQERQFIVLDAEQTTSQLAVLINADDGRGGRTSVPLLLQFDPRLAAAEPVVVQQVEILEFEPSTITDGIDAPAVAPLPSVPLAQVVTEEASNQEILETEELTEFVDLHSLITPLPTFGSLELAVLDDVTSGSQTDSLSRNFATDVDTFNLADLLNQPSSEFVAASSFLNEAMDKEEKAHLDRVNLSQTLIGGSAGLTTGLSVGYLIWLIRGGTLMGSVLSSLPAWRFVDPLPVLASLGDGDEDDDESLASIVEAGDQTEAPATPEQSNTEYPVPADGQIPGASERGDTT